MFIPKGYLHINGPDEYATAEAPEARRSNFVMLELETYMPPGYQDTDKTAPANGALSYITYEHFFSFAFLY